jgi:IS605 OrfB family transposase
VGERKKPYAPCQAETYKPAKLPRRANVGTTVFLHERKTKLTCYWLEIYNPQNRKHLWLPLNPSHYHLKQLRTGKSKVIQLVKHGNRRWCAHVNVKIKVPTCESIFRPPAVVGIDLGMNKAAVAVLLTANSTGILKGRDIKFFDQKEKKCVINRLDNTIASLQRTKEWYLEQDRCTDKITSKLRKLNTKRGEVAVQLDHELTAEIVNWIKRLEHRFTVHVAIGQLKGIRNSRRKGDGKSRQHRRELHHWAFTRITTMLEYKLSRAGVSKSRFIRVPEHWTSQTCSKCGSRDSHRPFQALLICRSCGVHLQADINGALNIAFKLIVSHDGDALDQWLINPLLAKKYPERSERTSGRRNSHTQSKIVLQVKTSESSLISRPINGDEIASTVSMAVEPVSNELLPRTITSTNERGFQL